MPLDWSSMEVLLAIHDGQSLSGAAKLLRVDQSTISRRLATLEDALGQRLFARSKLGAHPTPLAQELLPIALEMQRAMRQVKHISLRQDRDDAPIGHLRIALLETIADHVVIPALPDFFASHPGISLSLIMGAKVSDMSQLEADLAIRLVRPTTGELHIKRLSSDGGGVYGRGDYLAARAHLDLHQLDWISWDESLDFLPEARWIAQHLGVTPRLRCNRMHSIIAALRQGAGVAILGRGLAACFPELVERPVPVLAAHTTSLWLVRPTVHRHNALVSLVSAWLETLFEL